MGNKRITDLTPITIPSGLSILPIVHQGAVRQINLDNLFTYVDNQYFKSGKSPSVIDNLGYNYNQFKVISGNFLVSGSNITRIKDGILRVDKSGFFHDSLSGKNVYADNLYVSGLNLSGGVVGGDFTILGNLKVSGDLTTLSTDFEIEDKNITFASIPSGLYLNDSGLHGAGFTVKGSQSDKNITWYNTDINPNSASDFSGTWQFDQSLQVEKKLRVSGTTTFDSGVYLINSNSKNPLKFGSDVNLHASGSNTLATNGHMFIEKDLTVNDNLYVRDNLDVSGNSIRLLGDVTLGLSASNSITFLGGFAQDVKPVNDWLNSSSTPYQNLGISNKRWKQIFAGIGTFHDSVNVTGNVKITGDLFVTGNTYIGDSETDILDVKSTPLFKSTNSFFQNNLDVSGNVNIGESNSKSIFVKSKAYFNDGDVFVKNNQTVSGNLNVSGNTIIGDNVSDTLIINSTPTLNASQNNILNNLNIGQDLKVTGKFRIGNDSNIVLDTSSLAVNIHKNTNINSDVVVTGDVKITGTHDLYVDRSGYFNEGIKVGNSTVLITPNFITVNNDRLISTIPFSGLSGQLVSLSGDLLNSGSSLTTRLDSISGNLISTGSNLAAQLSTLSGNLAFTGNTLNVKTNTLSGYTESNFLKNNYTSGFGTGTVNGLISAYGFIGSGTSLTNLDASKITLGQLDNDRLNIANFTGDFYFPGNISIRNLSVLGTGIITNSEISNISNNFLTLNATGVGVIGNEGGIYVITGANSTGYNDTGAVIAWDKGTSKWHFGTFSRSQDLSNSTPYIASNVDLATASGILNTLIVDNYVTRNSNQTITGNKEFVTNVISPNLVYNTGNQTISGVKTFDSRPIYNNENLIVISDIANQNNLVFTTGNQTVSGTKEFNTRPTVNGTGVLLQNEATRLDNVVFQTGSQLISGIKDFNTTPTVNGIPVLVSGSAGSLSIQTQTLSITDGSIQQDIPFISNYPSNIKPVVIGNLFSTGEKEEIIPFQIQNITNTGFRVSISYPVTGYNFSFISFQNTGMNFIAQGAPGNVYNQRIQLNTGVISQEVNFNPVFSDLPAVNLQLEDRNNPQSDLFFLYKITGLSTGKCFIHLSDPISSLYTGFFMHLIATRPL